FAGSKGDPGSTEGHQMIGTVSRERLRRAVEQTGSRGLSSIPCIHVPTECHRGAAETDFKLKAFQGPRRGSDRLAVCRGVDHAERTDESSSIPNGDGVLLGKSGTGYRQQDHDAESSLNDTAHRHLPALTRLPATNQLICSG